MHSREPPGDSSSNATHRHYYWSQCRLPGCLESPGCSAGSTPCFSSVDPEGWPPDRESPDGRSDADDFHRCQWRGIAHFKLCFCIPASKQATSALCLSGGAALVSLHSRTDGARAEV